MGDLIYLDEYRRRKNARGGVFARSRKLDEIARGLLYRDTGGTGTSPVIGTADSSARKGQNFTVTFGGHLKSR